MSRTRQNAAQRRTVSLILWKVYQDRNWFGVKLTHFWWKEREREREREQLKGSGDELKQEKISAGALHRGSEKGACGGTRLSDGRAIRGSQQVIKVVLFLFTISTWVGQEEGWKNRTQQNRLEWGLIYAQIVNLPRYSPFSTCQKQFRASRRRLISFTNWNNLSKGRPVELID